MEGTKWAKSSCPKNPIHRELSFLTWLETFWKSSTHRACHHLIDPYLLVENAQSKPSKNVWRVGSLGRCSSDQSRVALAALGRKGSRGTRESLAPNFCLPIPQFLLLETSLKLQPKSSFQKKMRLWNEIVTPLGLKTHKCTGRRTKWNLWGFPEPFLHKPTALFPS